MRIILILQMLLALISGFCPQPSPPIRTTSHLLRADATTPSSSPSNITEFMAKAHEEKIAAMARVEAQYKQQIEDLQARVKELEGSGIETTKSETTVATASSENSFAFPATNKALAQKVVSYQKFISEYLVKAQAEKQKTVKDAEEKIIEKYEATIASLQDSEVPMQ